MGDADNNPQPSRKRAAGVQLSRDNPGLDDNEDSSEQEAGTFRRASDEVLATRRIVKVRRQQTSATPSAEAPPPASNPFASICLVPPSSASPVEVEASGAPSMGAEQIDKNNSKSENVAGEPKGESLADAKPLETKVDESKVDINSKNDNVVDVPKGESAADTKPPKNEVDESKVKINSEKNETDITDEQSLAKSVVEVSQGDNAENEAKRSTESDRSENEARKDAEGKRNDEKKGNGELASEKNAEAAPFSSFQQLSSSQNAFSGLAGTGFSSTSFSFGSISKNGSPVGSTTGSLFSLKNDQPSFGFGISSNGNSSIFGSSGANLVSKNEGDKFPSMQEVPVETGEENENAVFMSDSVLFEFIDGAWKERGKGELKVNVSATGTGKARLIMRARGNYRLILNASLFPDMKLTNMDKKGVTFACVNSASEGKNGLSTIALKFKDASIVEDFRAAVMEHKAKAAVAFKTPENSP